MTGTLLREARQGQGLTQQAAARAWGLSQTYLSLMEAGKRPVPEPLVRRLARVSPAALSALPKFDVRPDRVERALGRLGFPGFVHLTAREPLTNPAPVVLRAVTLDAVPARVVEALPWVLGRFVGMDWSWLVDHVKLANCQNRLGYLVHLSRQLAERSANAEAVSRLEAVERQLSDARLLKVDAFRRDLTDAERKYLAANRPEEAAYWNLLTRLRVEDLRYAD
jgi:transcriptional regulator with XRE-family HTH domain